MRIVCATNRNLEELVEQRTGELESSREQLRRAERLASIGTLSAGIAHEINNPVGMILLVAENAITYKERPDTMHLLDKCLDSIVMNAERCAYITNSVLQFARHEATEKTPVDLNGVIERGVLLTRKYAKEHDAAIDLKLAEDLPQVPANSVELEQVFVNLLRNAVDLAVDDVQIVIRTERTQDLVRVFVEDNGPGVAQRQVNHLFDPFFTTRREQGGTGLGLSIVHGIITGHGGTIDVESRLGEGTVFTIELPYETGAGAEVADGQGTDR